MAETIWTKAREALDAPYLRADDDMALDGEEIQAIAAALDAGEKAERRIVEAERAGEMPLDMIAPTLEAHRKTAQADHECAEKAERERDEARIWECDMQVTQTRYDEMLRALAKAREERDAALQAAAERAAARDGTTLLTEALLRLRALILRQIEVGTEGDWERALTGVLTVHVLALTDPPASSAPPPEETALPPIVGGYKCAGCHLCTCPSCGVSPHAPCLPTCEDPSPASPSCARPPSAMSVPAPLCECGHTHKGSAAHHYWTRGGNRLLCPCTVFRLARPQGGGEETP